MHRLKQSLNHGSSSISRRKGAKHKLRNRAPRPRLRRGARTAIKESAEADTSNAGQERTAASAASARALSTVKNCWLWPMKSPLAVRPLTAATAPANSSTTGRIIETWGRSPLNSKGTGKIRLGWVAFLSGLKKLGNDSPEMASVKGATGACTPLPEKSTHSK